MLITNAPERNKSFCFIWPSNFSCIEFSLINWVFLFYQQAATEAANNKVKIRVGDGFLVWKGWLLIVGSIERGGICEFVNVAYVSVDDWYWYPNSKCDIDKANLHLLLSELWFFLIPKILHNLLWSQSYVFRLPLDNKIQNLFQVYYSQEYATITLFMYPLSIFYVLLLIPRK